MTVERMLDNIIQARAGGRVERCHAIPHQGGYSNAAHSWGVAMLMHALWPEDFSRLAIYCLSHDVPEAWVGDIPAPLLRYVPGLKVSLGGLEDGLNRLIDLPAESELNDLDYAKLKACDKLEFYLWCREQGLMGNGFANEASVEICKYLRTSLMPAPAEELFLAIQRNSVLPRQAHVIEKAVVHES